jgi:hypothetical protein
MLQELELFISIPGALLTTLRIFTSIPFMLDLELLYKNSSGIRVYCMSYALVTVVVLCALVTSVANKLFQSQVSIKHKLSWVHAQYLLQILRCNAAARSELAASIMYA